MANIKTHTDIEQSKKLAEILPLESADMHYHYDNDFGEFESIPTITEEDDHFILFPKDVRCWSLAALLGVLPKRIPHKDAKYNEERKHWTYSWLLTSKCLFYKCTILLENGGRYDDVFAEVYHQDNPVDACYEMIQKLNELKIL